MMLQNVRSLKLLDYLNIDWTYLRDERCCGQPAIEWGIGSQEALEKTNEACEEMNSWNLDQARALGPKRVIYLCQWCAYIAKRFCSGDGTDLIYYLSILVEHIEKLKKTKLRLPPTRVGYFEGCHLRNISFAPGVEIPWKSYRQLLEIIDGAEIVDLPSWKCCAHPHNEQIVEEAQKLGLSGIVTPCQGCWSWLERIGFKKGLPVKMLQEVVLEAVDYVTGQNLSKIG